MSAQALPNGPLGVVIVALTARRFLGLSDAQVRDLATYLKSL
jgi:hypothetical protein